MGYEDKMVDKQKRNYRNIRRPKTKISQNKNIHNASTINFSISKENEYSLTNKTNSNKKPFKKKKIRCKKRFKFSKYHSISKKALYDYQIDECKEGLKDDAIKQMEHILDLISNCENKSHIKCKIEEIYEFIKHHNLVDDNIENLKEMIENSFKKNFD